MSCAMKKDFLIKDKIKRLIDCGFFVSRKKTLNDLREEFYHPDNSMRVKVVELKEFSGFSFRLRVDGSISEKTIGTTLHWLSSVADSHDFLLEGWRVVTKVKS